MTDLSGTDGALARPRDTAPGGDGGATGAAGGPAPTAVDPAAADDPVDRDAADDSAAAEVGADAGGDTGDASARGAGRRATTLVVGGLTSVIALPIAVATVAVRTPRWYPLVDLAQIEMRIRDVGTDHPPLVGMGGRIFGLGEQGAHPGPISFYLLAPVYRLLGATPWAMQVSAALVNVAVLAATVWVAHRRRGPAGAIVAAAGLALVMRLYGTTVLVFPWNPYMPVLFWALFLVCVWAVLCGDVPLLPVAVLAGSVCAQTHLPYVGLVGGMGALVVAGLVARYVRSAGDAAARRRLAAWVAGSVALGALLWSPVVVDQVTGDPGNVSIIADSLADPVDPAIGAATGTRLFVEHLDLVHLATGDREGAGSWPLGAVLLVTWAAAAVVAVRGRDRDLVRLHVVVAAALCLGAVTAARIFGVPWFYLTLWAYGTAVLALAAIVATVAVLVAPQRGDGRDRTASAGWRRVAAAAAVVAVGVPTVALLWGAPGTEDTDADESAHLAAVVEPTVAALDDVTGEASVDDASYLVTWADPLYLGGQGLGLMLELERRGYDVGAPEFVEPSVREHRVLAAADADVQIHVAAGVGPIADAESRPGAREVARVDPRTDEQIAEYDRIRTHVIDTLTAEGLDDLVPAVDTNTFGLAADHRLPASLAAPLHRLGDIPQPLAVFIWEPDR